MNSPRRPIILAYSAIFPVVCFAVALFLGLVSGNKFPGMIGSPLAVVVAVLFIAWVFVKRHRRHFTTSEYRWLMGYCLAWKLGLELVGDYYFYTQMKDTHGMSFAAMLARSFPLTALIQAAQVYIGFEIGKKFMSALVARLN